MENNKNTLLSKYIKEDGSFDIEKINQLPLQEYIDLMDEMNQKQYNEYCAICKKSLKPGGRIRTIKTDYTLGDELKRGAVLADDFIKELRAGCNTPQKNQE